MTKHLLIAFVCVFALVFVAGCPELATGIETAAQSVADNPPPVTDNPIAWAQWLLALGAAVIGTVGGAVAYPTVVRPMRIAKQVERGEVDIEALSEKLAARVLTQLSKNVKPPTG